MKQKNLLKFLFYTFTMLLTLTYIIYRIFFTLPKKLGILALCTSILVLLIEIWEFFDFFVYYLNILCVNKKSPKIPSLDNIKEYPHVDILIATLNEHESILENTITACKNIQYPDKSKIHIYLCDDGNRKNIKNLAEKLEINYLTRLTNKNAKAGNYNHALPHLTSPFVATFDADMAPTPNFLLTTLPFFYAYKEEIGFIQLPQSYMNPDIFQYRFNLVDKIPFEQDYFYHSIQLAKNNTNSAIYCGTNTLFSRKALNSCNGFATGTISEDIATGMKIESNGYKCLALNNVEAYGIAVNDLTGFIKQRSRWAKGCIQILKKYKILRNKGLSFRQKLEYLSCISYWFFGIRRMIYLLTPLLFSIFGIIIVDCNLTTFISLWLPTYILKELIGFENTKFEVTPKFAPSPKMSKTNKTLLTNHLLLLMLNIIGLIMCLIRINSVGISVYVLSLLWIISNIFYLTTSVIFDLRYKPIKYNEFIPNRVLVFKKLSIIRIFFNTKKKNAKKI